MNCVSQIGESVLFMIWQGSYHFQASPCQISSCLQSEVQLVGGASPAVPHLE